MALEAAKNIDMPNGSKRRRCDCCGTGIPPYDQMQGSGFQSETIDHYWVESDVDKNYHMPVHLELCYRCYLEDYALNYPNAAPPNIVNARDWEEMPQSAPPTPIASPLAEYFTTYFA